VSPREQISRGSWPVWRKGSTAASHKLLDDLTLAQERVASHPGEVVGPGLGRALEISDLISRGTVGEEREPLLAPVRLGAFENPGHAVKGEPNVLEFLDREFPRIDGIEASSEPLAGDHAADYGVVSCRESQAPEPPRKSRTTDEPSPG
jgi:hypothetical protein